MKSVYLSAAALVILHPATVLANDLANDEASDQASDIARESERNSGAFSLGQIIVTSTATTQSGIDQERISGSAMEDFKRETVADAVNLLPNVNLGNTGGSRNERLIFVRGFDRYQIPLSIDGVRIYRPADNRLDFGQFLTAESAEVQVAKGYASVLDGPGAMGGAINIVTRQPTKVFEAEMSASADADRSMAYAGYSASGRIGTRQDSWYAQASFSRRDREHWTLPKSFVPVTANEDGGTRDFSEAEDWRLNLKAGYTPNATDEYSLSFTKQDGSKNAPLHISDSTTSASLRNWSWPTSKVESLYFLSKTELTDQVTVKSQIYRTSFDNLLQSWDNRSQNSQTLNRAFDSPYWDTAVGGAVQLGFAVSAQNQLTFAAHYRHDEHKEAQTSRPGAVNAATEPVQTNEEQTWSFAVENRHMLSPEWALTVGASYDWRGVDRAEDYSAALGLYSHPTKQAQGWNGQTRIDWNGNEGHSAYALLSSRIRFPTVFERFSSQFGTAAANPDLMPERATNAEVGASTQQGPLRLSGAVFHSWLTDALVSVRLQGNVNQRQNLGSARFYGGEITLAAELSPSLSLGANYGYIHRDFETGTAPTGGFIRAFRLTDVPGHKALFYAEWTPVKSLRIQPSVEWASKRMTVTPATANNDTPYYYKTGAYVLADLHIDYAVTDKISLGLGVRNAFDHLYTLTDGFPEEGRSFYSSARWAF